METLFIAVTNYDVVVTLFMCDFYLKRELQNSLGVDSPRKEVIHPQLRLGIPCYNLALIADLTLVPGNPRYQALPTLLA